MTKVKKSWEEMNQLERWIENLQYEIKEYQAFVDGNRRNTNIRMIVVNAIDRERERTQELLEHLLKRQANGETTL